MAITNTSFILHNVRIWFLIKTNPENIIDKIKKKKKSFRGLREFKQTEKTNKIERIVVTHETHI